MPKTAVQTKICDICGAEVREGSQFCYNCGGSLQQAVEASPDPDVNVAQPAAPANGLVKKRDDALGAKRRKRNIERGPVEVVWEPREGISAPFVIGAVVLLLIAGLLFGAAMWLK